MLLNLSVWGSSVKLFFTFSNDVHFLFVSRDLLCQQQLSGQKKAVQRAAETLIISCYDV